MIGAVQGDVHDIGKAIIIASFKGQFLEVHDLGRYCSIDNFRAKAEQHEADIIGMSALLTTTAEVQKKLIARRKDAGACDKYKVMVGGAAAQRWADQISAKTFAEIAIQAVAAARRLVGFEGIWRAAPPSMNHVTA